MCKLTAVFEIPKLLEKGSYANTERLDTLETLSSRILKFNLFTEREHGAEYYEVGRAVNIVP